MTPICSKQLSISGLLFSFILCAGAACAQDVPDVTVAAALSTLGGRAGAVFAGEVIAVRHLDGIVEVDFQVSQNIKVATAGSYTLREWSGLWAGGQRRYWVGERAVVFLNRPGKSGLSSSVDGMEGILPILPGGSNALVVDVQRLRSRVLRTAGAPMVDSGAQMSFAEVAAVVNPQPVTTPVRIPVAPVGIPVAQPMPSPVRTQTVTTFPNPAYVPVQNSVVLVMNPDQDDDFLFTDDVEPKHKKTDTLDAAH